MKIKKTKNWIVCRSETETNQILKQNEEEPQKENKQRKWGCAVKAETWEGQVAEEGEGEKGDTLV